MYFSMAAAKVAFGTAPVTPPFLSPFLNISTVGILVIQILEKKVLKSVIQPFLSICGNWYNATFCMYMFLDNITLK